MTAEAIIKLFRRNPAPPFVGKACEICKKPEQFTAKTAVVSWQDETTERFAHEACFYKAQADALTKEVDGLRQLAAIAVAAWGGTVNVSFAHVQHAAERGNIVRAEPRPGGLRLRLGDKLPASEQVGTEAGVTP